MESDEGNNMQDIASKPLSKSHGGASSLYLVDVGADEEGLKEGIGVGQVVLLNEVHVRGKTIPWAPSQCCLPGPCTSHFYLLPVKNDTPFLTFAS